MLSRQRNRMAAVLVILCWLGAAMSTLAFIQTTRTASRGPSITLPRRPFSLSLSAPENSHESASEAGTRHADDDTSGGARIAYLVVVHDQRTIDDAANLFRAIRSPRNIIMIHVDTKLDWDVYLKSKLYQEVEHSAEGTTVVVSAVHSAEWSSWSMNDPTHWGMELATTKFWGQWDVFVNLSGDCMPVYNAQVMAKLFDPVSGPLRKANFCTSSCCETGLLPTSVLHFPTEWHKRNHYGNPLVKYVDEAGVDQQTFLEVHWGSQWMALQPDFCRYLIESLKRPDSLPSKYRDALIDTERLMTDETFIPTLLMHQLPFNETMPVVNDDGSLKAMPSLKTMR